MAQIKRWNLGWAGGRTSAGSRGVCAGCASGLLMVALGVQVAGCGPSYNRLRHEGQEAMARGAYGPARIFFRQADEKRPRKPENLHDLGVCSVMLAREKFEERNHAAAMRELDDALAYYSAAIDAYPGHQASIEGKHTALKLRGQFEAAMKHAEWAAEFVGPSARQYIFLARDLEANGDTEGALLRYRQAVAVEPRNPEAHTAIAKFLIKNHNEPAAVHHLQMAYRLNPRDEWVVDELTSRGALPPLAPASQPEP